jgi:alpha-glucan, water dikinase
MAEYKDGVVGAKSKNLQALRGELPKWIALPSSVTLPFCCFEEALEDSANQHVKDALLTAAKRVPDSPAKHLYECRCVTCVCIHSWLLRVSFASSGPHGSEDSHL